VLKSVKNEFVGRKKTKTGNYINKKNKIKGRHA
jgi:hypothetical protein